MVLIANLLPYERRVISKKVLKVFDVPRFWIDETTETGQLGLGSKLERFRHH
jgi:hypothetical protein